MAAASTKGPKAPRDASEKGRSFVARKKRPDYDAFKADLSKASKKIDGLVARMVSPPAPFGRAPSIDRSQTETSNTIAAFKSNQQSKKTEDGSSDGASQKTFQLLKAENKTLKDKRDRLMEQLRSSQGAQKQRVDLFGLFDKRWI